MLHFDAEVYVAQSLAGLTRFSPCLSVLQGMVVNPEEGDYFAVIPSASPAGSPSSISTSFIVPPCASSISASYIFACGDYYPYTDKVGRSCCYRDWGRAGCTVQLLPSC